MAFRFILAPLLRLRQSLERQRALALQQAAFNLTRAQDTLAHLDRFLAESKLADAASLAAGRTAAELQFADLLREQLNQLRLQFEEEVRRLEGLREQTARAYQQAYREREALETLRAHQLRTYHVEQLRRQQRELDAAFLLQRWHRRSG